MGGFLRMARAIAMRCFWPPDSRAPRLAEEGVVTLGQLADELVGRRGARRRLDFRVAGVGPSVTDVLARAGAEDHGFLRHQADARAHRLRIGAGDVDAVDEDAPRGGS